MDYLTDTTFLIDMWRERGKPCAALRFVEKNGQAVCGLPWIAKGEFLRGAWLAGHIHDSVKLFSIRFSWSCRRRRPCAITRNFICNCER